MARIALVLLAALVYSQSAQADDSLFQALGGQPGLTGIVNATVDLAVKDERIADRMDNINVARLKQRIYQQLCDVTGGPCHYTGRTMHQAHAHLYLHNAHFNALVEDLEAAMDHANIPIRVQNKLLARLAPMQRDVVQR